MNKRPSIVYPAAIAALLLLFACQPKPAPADEKTDTRLDFTIIPGERVGLITANSASQDDVLAMYGDSARTDSIYLGEGLAAPGVVVFPNSSRNRLKIFWDPEIDPQRPAFIRIGGEGETDWKTDNGITIGSAIAEVERLNGKPFELYGFGWDYGGLVNDWKGGALNDHLGLRFELQTEKEIPMEVLGETILSSDNATLRSLNPVVAMMELSFPRTNLMPLLQGRWQSVSDPGYQIEITEGKIRHYNEGELTVENQIEADAGCSSNACTINDARLNGFCFIEKGEFDAQCNLVLACDGQRLEYTAIGTTGQALVFERMN